MQTCWMHKLISEEVNNESRKIQQNWGIVIKYNKQNGEIQQKKKKKKKKKYRRQKPFGVIQNRSLPLVSDRWFANDEYL